MKTNPRFILSTNYTCAVAGIDASKHFGTYDYKSSAQHECDTFNGSSAVLRERYHGTAAQAKVVRVFVACLTYSTGENNTASTHTLHLKARNIESAARAVERLNKQLARTFA